MCNRLCINDGETWCDTAGELAAFVGAENVLQFACETDALEAVDPSELAEHPNSCLCWIAVPETMERLGYTVECDGMDWLASNRDSPTLPPVV